MSRRAQRSAAAAEPCLVTGGAGFIGSHLVEALLERGHAVRVFDNLSSGRRENLPQGCEFVEGDLRDAAAVTRAVLGMRGVFHLAAFVSVPRSVEQPHECNAVNIDGTLTLLQAAARAGVRRLVLASSTAVYGEAQPPVCENTRERPCSPYAASKLTAEQLCAVAGPALGMETVSLRFFNVYGPRQDPSSAYAAVIPLFVSRLLAGLPLSIYGDGRQTRDFIYVRDIVRALMRAQTAPGVSGRVFNVGTGRAVSIRDLAETLCRVLWKQPALEFLPPRAGDITHSWADVTAASRDLGFRSVTKLETGLRRTMEWFAARQGAQAAKVRGQSA